MKTPGPASGGYSPFLAAEAAAARAAAHGSPGQDMTCVAGGLGCEDMLIGFKELLR